MCGLSPKYSKNCNIFCGRTQSVYLHCWVKIVLSSICQIGNSGLFTSKITYFLSCHTCISHHNKTKQRRSTAKARAIRNALVRLNVLMTNNELNCTPKMDYNININKICRVCLEESVLTSIFNTEFAMMPAEMMMLCAKVKVCDSALSTKLHKMRFE